MPGLPYTRKIRTHNSHRHNITPPLQTLVQAPYPVPTYTTATQIQTHVEHFPVPTGLVKPKRHTCIYHLNFRKPSSLLKQTHPNYITMITDRLHKEEGVPITLIRDNITFTTDIPSTMNTHKFKWSRYTLTTLNISQLQTFITIIPLAHHHHN